MRSSDRSSSFFNQWIRPLLIGAAVGIIGCVLLLMLSAAIVQTIDIPRKATVPLAVIAAALGALAGGFVAARVAGRRGLMVGAACGAVLFLLVLLAGFVRYAGVSGGYAAVKLAALTVCGALGGLLGVSPRRR